MKMHNTLTASPVIDRLDTLLANVTPPEPGTAQVVVNAPPSRVDRLFAAINPDAPARRVSRQPSQRRAGIPVPAMRPVAEAPWDLRNL